MVESFPIRGWVQCRRHSSEASQSRLPSSSHHHHHHHRPQVLACSTRTGAVGSPESESELQTVTLASIHGFVRELQAPSLPVPRWLRDEPTPARHRGAVFVVVVSTSDTLAVLVSRCVAIHTRSLSSLPGSNSSVFIHRSLIKLFVHGPGDPSATAALLREV